MLVFRAAKKIKIHARHLGILLTYQMTLNQWYAEPSYPREPNIGLFEGVVRRAKGHWDYIWGRHFRG